MAIDRFALGGNIAAAERERQRRQQLLNEGAISPQDAAQSAYSGSLGWDALFGSLHDTEDAANAAGMNFRLNTNAIGNAMPSRASQRSAPSAGSLGYGAGDDGVDEQSFALNEYLARESERRKQQAEAEDQANRNAMMTAYQQQVLASGQPPPDSTIRTETVGANGQPEAYSLKPARTMSDEERTLRTLPPNLRPQYMAQLQAQKVQQQLADAATTKAAQPSGSMSGMNALYSDTDPKAIAAAIRTGGHPPDISQYGRPVQGAIASELSKPGPDGEPPFNLSTAQTDWKATQKHIATMNGAQQLRLNQAVNQLPELLDSVETLAKSWDAGKFPLLNKANLALAKNGAYGTEAANIATQLDAQLADVTGDLATVYMGGNSPTDQGLQLAAKNLSGDWQRDVLLSGIDRARKNVEIRRNSINNTGVAGASAGNAYGGGAKNNETPEERFKRLGGGR